MTFRDKIDNFYTKYSIGKWGLIGVGGFVFLGLLICQIGAVDLNGCSYNWLNHAISELGAVGDSWSWPLFSICLIIGGILSCIYLVGLSLYVEGKFAKPISILALLVGIVCAIAMAGVGIFPYNINLQGHIVTALTFFFTAMITPIIFSIAILVQDKGKGRQKIPRWYAIFGFIVAIIVKIFLEQDMSSIVATIAEDGCREGLSPGPFWEWMVYYSVSLWMIFFSFVTLKKNTKKVLD